MPKRGRIFLIAGPSGVGKNTILQALKTEFPTFYFPVPYTTRSPRLGERDGKDLFFLDMEQFRTMVGKNAFIEFARVHNHWYAYARSPLCEKIAAGVNVLMLQDNQGASIIKEQYPNAVLVYVQYDPCVLVEDQVRHRLIRDPKRTGITESEIDRRIITSLEEEANKHRFDFIVTNHEGRLEEAVGNIRRIILAHLET